MQSLKQDTFEASHFGVFEKKFNIWVLDYNFSYLLVELKSCNDLRFVSVNLTEQTLKMWNNLLVSGTT